ncbi:MAG TPA: 50S ribosomal protein L11 methyltransferase [Burkholderiales bacterium]|nr:50S ribosomal protein L11 methyltransferase [Burkholderiales bacterium]
MKAPFEILLRVLLAGALLAAAPAQPAEQPRPKLDVPYVPTNQATVDAMVHVANVGPNDFVIDLGSGDGRILITAAKQRGARGFGVDIDPQRVSEAIENAKAAGVSDRVRFLQRNLYETKISEATVVTLYLLPRINIELRPRLLAELKPGTRVVSHDFDMGDWQADLRVTVRGAGSEVYYWVIPAQVAGHWQVKAAAPRGRQSFEVEFKQKYQELEGTVRGFERPAAVQDARVDGDRVLFTVVDDADFAHRVRYEGKISGNVISGLLRGDGSAPRGEHKWRAVRAP